MNEASHVRIAAAGGTHTAAIAAMVFIFAVTLIGGSAVLVMSTIG